MRLRDATVSDLPVLLDVQESGAVRAFAHIFPQETHPFPRAAIRARWTAEISAPDVAAYVVEDDAGGLVGFAAIRGDELLHFGTAVETWGTGLAVSAHAQLLERLAATGAARARLWVFEENRRARRFYEKLGWRGTDRLRRTSFPPHPVLVEYVRDL
jgi:RimJ/RimL family protein N-acetyltransferase